MVPDVSILPGFRIFNRQIFLRLKNSNHFSLYKLHSYLKPIFSIECRNGTLSAKTEI